MPFADSTGVAERYPSRYRPIARDLSLRALAL